MAQTRRTNRKTEYGRSEYRRSARYYESGSAAHDYDYRTEAEPVRRKRRVEEAEPVRRTKKHKRHAKKSRTYEKSAIIARNSESFGFGYTALVMIAVILAFVSVSGMLAAESKVKSQEIHINSMIAELNVKKNDNVAMQDELDKMYSLDDIYRIATGELGMVYSEEGQVIYYDSVNEDYVNQYEDVPEAR